jgi:TolB protein
MNGKIAFVAGVHNEVFTVTSNGARLRRLALFPDPSGLSWSPDGRSLVLAIFAGANGSKIVTARADGSDVQDVRPPCTGPCSDYFPAYSPDGKRIVFERSWAVLGGWDSAIFTMDPDGGNLTQLTQLTQSASADSQPEWSPNGREIVFVRTYDRSVIAVMNADGSHIRRVTPLRLDAGDPHWSPNGRGILFSTHIVSTPGKSANLYTMHPDGTHRVPLTHYRGATQALAEAWSPDGTEILFNRVTPSGGGLYILNLRSRHTRRLTIETTNAYSRAAWGKRP